MGQNHIQDRVHWGLNRAAAVLGITTDVYRPKGTSSPLIQTNRFIRLNAAFGRGDDDFSKPISYETYTWRGYFDASYTRPGDYLVQREDVWFIISQQRLLPVLCVKANQLVSVTRPMPPDTGSSYGNGQPGAEQWLLRDWPASLRGISGRQQPTAQIPGDTTSPSSTLLLPPIQDAMIRNADIVAARDGFKGIVVAAESTDLGWRLGIRQIST